MPTTFRTVAELLRGEDAPLPLDVIPNHMGINLVSVEGMSWTRQDDGQLVSLTIHFKPAHDAAFPADTAPAEIIIGQRVRLIEKDGSMRVAMVPASAVPPDLILRDGRFYLRSDSHHYDIGSDKRVPIYYAET